MTGYSYLLAGNALGGLLAAALADRLSRSPRLAPVIVGGILLQAVPFALTTLVHNPSVGFVLQVISGVGMIIVDVLAITALQRDIPRELLSRVLSIGDMAIFGATLAASFIFAAVYTTFGLHTSLLVLGIGFPVAALLGIRPLLIADRRAVATIRELAPRIALLRALDLFAAASNNTLERLAADLEPVEFPAGATVLREGDPADALYVIVDGEVSASARGEGDDRAVPAHGRPGRVRRRDRAPHGRPADRDRHGGDAAHDVAAARRGLPGRAPGVAGELVAPADLRGPTRADAPAAGGRLARRPGAEPRGQARAARRLSRPTAGRRRGRTAPERPTVKLSEAMAKSPENG